MSISNLIQSGLARVNSGEGIVTRMKFGSDQTFVKSFIANLEEYEAAKGTNNPVDLRPKENSVFLEMSTISVFPDWKVKNGTSGKGVPYHIGQMPDVKCEVVVKNILGVSGKGQVLIGTAHAAKDGEVECAVLVGQSENGKYWVAFRAIQPTTDLTVLADFAKKYEPELNVVEVVAG